MPQDFDMCVAEGGRVRTMKVGKDKHAYVCYDKAGKSHMGEIKTKGKKKEK